MMVKTKVNGEFNIILPKHRADRPEWYTEAGWEKKRLQHMHEHLTEGDVLYYVGAEEGDMPALCAMWGAELVLFEPNPKVFPNIKAIFDANGLKAPWCWTGFASNLDDGLALSQGFPPCADGEVIGDHGFMELRNRNAPQIKIDTLDQMLSYDPGISITALSIDVEGSEWQVLRGAEKTLREKRPKIWLSLHPEFMYEHYKEYAFDLRNWLKSLGYKETLLDYQHECHLFYEADK